MARAQFSSTGPESKPEYKDSAGLLGPKKIIRIAEGISEKRLTLKCSMGKARLYSPRSPKFVQLMPKVKYPPFCLTSTVGNIEFHLSVDGKKVRFNGHNHSPHFPGTEEGKMFDGLLIGSMNRLFEDGDTSLVKCSGHSPRVREAVGEEIRSYRDRLLFDLDDNPDKKGKAMLEAARINLAKEVLADIDFEGKGSGEFIKFALLDARYLEGLSAIDSFISFSFLEGGEPGLYAVCTSFREKGHVNIWHNPDEKFPSFILGDKKLAISFETYDAPIPEVAKAETIFMG